MHPTDLSVAPDLLTVTWSDGTASAFPTIWLRDNCPSGLHPQTGERDFDLLSVPARPTLAAAALEEGALVLQWADGHRSRFPPGWLAARRLVRAADPADLVPVLWPRGMAAGDLPRHGAADILTSDGALRDCIVDLLRHGLTLVDGVADDPAAGVALAERIGFLRRTNFGEVFEVQSKPDPNNLAYTAAALPLHTDLPNQEVPPGVQFLHCLANGAEGGGSVFADGFAMAEALRLEDTAAFERLAQVAIPFRFHDGETDIRARSPVIVRSQGVVREIRFNAHIAGVFDMPADQMQAYYDAYRAFMARTRDPGAQVTLRLRPGEMAVFDNRRILHGREPFDPTSGWRHLHGCYVDRGEVLSRLRVLARDG